jgi:hypothetical protein
LVQHKLYLNLEKCEIMKPQITYLGNIIGRYGTMPTKERTQAVRLWPTPMDVSDVRAFLGLCGFVRRWILDFADLAAPLNLLLKKGEPWHWGGLQKLGFASDRCSDSKRQGRVAHRRLTGGHGQL